MRAGLMYKEQESPTPPTPTLLTYEEIVAMATAEGYPRTSTKAELNTYPEDYYDMLNDGGHLFQGGMRPYINGISYTRTRPRVTIVLGCDLSVAPHRVETSP